MKTLFVVLDEAGNVTSNADGSAAESFQTFAKAEKRAREMADIYPGSDIMICQAVACVKAPVGKITTTKL